MKLSALDQPRVPTEIANADIPYPMERVCGPEQSLARVWVNTGLVRRDITRGFNGLSGTAAGAPLDLRMELRSISNGQTLSRHAVYVWHADASGQYSVFGKPDTNYLRGIGVTDINGRVTYSTVFPGTYRGRIPHIHFEVYRNLDTLHIGAKPIIRSRILFSDAATQSIYLGSSCYADSLERYRQLNFERPVTDPQRDDRSVQVANITAAGIDKFRASLTAFLPTPS